MTLKYQTGEEILKGDNVLLSGEHGVIQIVADPSFEEPETLWYVQEFGGGVMISQLGRLGSVFVDDPESDGDLEFVSRADQDGEHV
jgi:hypothetical protein